MGDEPSFGTVELACDNLADMAAGVAAHAAIAQSYAELRYLPGVAFASRCTVAYLRALVAAADEVERSQALVAYRKSAENIGPGAGV